MFLATSPHPTGGAANEAAIAPKHNPAGAEDARSTPEEGAKVASAPLPANELEQLPAKVPDAKPLADDAPKETPGNENKVDEERIKFRQELKDTLLLAANQAGPMIDQACRRKSRESDPEQVRAGS